MFSDGSDLEFGEFYLSAFLGITSLALVENVVFFSKPKGKKVIIGRTPRSCTHVHVTMLQIDGFTKMAELSQYVATFVL